MSSEKEVKEVEMEEPKRMQGPRGYWSSSSRRENTADGSLLSLYVTDQAKGLILAATVTRPVLKLRFNHNTFHLKL